MSNFKRSDLASLVAVVLYVASMFLETLTGGMAGDMRGWQTAWACLCTGVKSPLSIAGTLANVAFLTAIVLTWRRKDRVAMTLAVVSTAAAGVCGLGIEDLRELPGWWVWTSSFVVLACGLAGPLWAWLGAPREATRGEALRAGAVALPATIVGTFLLLPHADRWLTDAVLVPPLVAIATSVAGATFVGVLAARLRLAPRRELDAPARSPSGVPEPATG